MARTVKLQIRGRGAETDAPTVADLLDQIRDYFEILKGVEEAVAEDGTVQVEWRVVDASKNSPLAIEAAPFAKQFAVNVDRRAEIVLKATAEGLHALQTGTGGRPAYFSEKVLARAGDFFDRVRNGLAETAVEYGPGLPGMRLTHSSATAASTHLRQILTPPAKVYKELGSIEAWAHSLTRDAGGNPALRVQHRLTGDVFPCRLFGQALKEVEARQVRDILARSRVQIFGVIHFKALGRISRVEARRVKFLRARDELPDISDILDPRFTGGLATEDYLERLRNGRLS